MSKTINTRLKLKYDTLANWTSVASTFIPLKGEMCVVEIPSGTDSTTATNPPTIMFKVGDGTSTFANLAWCSGRASDVYSWAKSSTKPSYTADEIKLSLTSKNTVASAINTLEQSISSIKPFEYEVVSTLPTASDSTMYKIYLVADNHDYNTDNYDEYITLRSGTAGSYTYAWEKIGNTDVDLSNYVNTVEQSGTTGIITSVTKSGNKITVTGTNLTQTKTVTSGKYITKISQDAQGKISIGESSLPTDNNQTIEGNGTAFGANDAVNIVGGNNVTVTADTTNKKITIDGKPGTVTSVMVKGDDYITIGAEGGAVINISTNSAAIASSGTAKLTLSSKVVNTDDQVIIDCGSSTTNTF